MWWFHSILVIASSITTSSFAARPVTGTVPVDYEYDEDLDELGYDNVTEDDEVTAAQNALEESEAAEHGDSRELEEEKNSHVLLEKLKDFYHPQYGDVHQTLSAIAKAQNESVNAARAWNANSFQGVKELHMFMTRSTHETQNVLMSDAMRVNDAIRKNFRDEMAKIDAMSLSKEARKKIQEEKSLNILLPPNTARNEFNGRRFVGSLDYSRANKEYVCGKKGDVLSFIPEAVCWKVRFDTAEEDTSSIGEWEPCLYEGEFQLLPDEVTTASNEKQRQHQKPKEFVASGKMGRFATDPYVVVDHIPLTTGVTGGSPLLWLHKICKVISWNALMNAYEVKRPNDPTNYKTSTYSDDALYLLPDRDFHTFTDIAGQSVQVNHFEERHEDMPPEAFYGSGRVISFDPVKMKYKVKIPSKTLEVSPKEITRLQRRVVTKWVWEEKAIKDEKLLRFFHAHGEKTPEISHEVTTSQAALLTQRERKNMEAIANENPPLIKKVSEMGDGSWAKTVRDIKNGVERRRDKDSILLTHDEFINKYGPDQGQDNWRAAVSESEYDISFKDWAWTMSAQNAFQMLKDRMAKYETGVGMKMKEALLAWMLFLLPPGSLDFRQWFSSSVLYKCGHQPLGLKDLYYLKNVGKLCSRQTPTHNARCADSCTQNENCYFYALSPLKKDCFMFETCEDLIDAKEDFVEGKETPEYANIHLFAKKANCWKMSGDHPLSGFNKPLIVIEGGDIEDVRNRITALEDAYASDSKVPPHESNDRSLPWDLTTEGFKAVNDLSELFKGETKPGDPVTKERIDTILKIPGMDVEQWFYGRSPFVTGPSGFEKQAHAEQKQIEERTDPSVYYVDGNFLQRKIGWVQDPKRDKAKVIIWRKTAASPWEPGVIFEAKPKTIDEYAKRPLTLGDWYYNIYPVDADGRVREMRIVSGQDDGSSSFSNEEEMLWMTNWFDPRSKYWKPEGYEDIDAYILWVAAQKIQFEYHQDPANPKSVEKLRYFGDERIDKINEETINRLLAKKESARSLLQLRSQGSLVREHRRGLLEDIAANVSFDGH